MPMTHVPARLIPESRALTAAQFQGLAEVPPELLIDMINVVLPPDYLSSKNVKPNKDAKHRFIPAAT